ncbi:uncharacterized protein LOC110104951 isoform X1 [Dendrobium catenatum]|uniref:uncharacterized protein LOC110104951 isoform X1 n=1 Tax=Dendrobium catenatum TaxID=906689 RepID=UPI0009F6988D|nr:uncharacterized protein LOC110104951 isoform X1 [Dendrobium catenatum]XP_020689924.1 uncharacterized protein LOC110104951 isoform X1 [Dendrobium catenatum]
MEKLRQIGEAIGSLRAFMAFREEIQINRRQCCLLFDAFSLAFDVITQELRQHLRFDENQTNWHALENPMKELHKVIKEGEYYVKQCLEPKDWWAKAISLNLNTDCVEFHLHNLLWCFTVVLEAIENAGEISGQDLETIQLKRIVLLKKYEHAWMERKLFFHRFAEHYLLSQEMCNSFSSVWKEDRWLLTELISEKKISMTLTKHESQLAELVLAPRDELHSTSVLAGSKDFQVRRRLGDGGQYKEVQWMGESFALRHCFCDSNSMSAEISLLTSVMHPNVLNYMYVFSDDERKEHFVLMELMNKDLGRYIKEISSARRRVPFPLLVAVDIMIQIARGMEYLHSKKLYHGDLNPSNILVRSRSHSSDGYLHVKITGFGQSGTKSWKQSSQSSNQTDKYHCIWYAPEVLAEQERSPRSQSAKFTEKADVYSFAMICFELLAGKIPFEDDHLQGDRMSRNIRAGERPLFPSQSPKYLTNLTKKCWHDDPSQRPSFSSICRVLRYTKRFLIMHPDHNQPDLPSPPADYLDIEMCLLNKFKVWTTVEASKVSEIPFQMFCYRVLERERDKTSMNQTERCLDSESDQTSVCGDEIGLQMMVQGKAFSNSGALPRSQSQPEILKKLSGKLDMKASKLSAQKKKAKATNQPQLLIREHHLRKNSGSPLDPAMSPSPRSLRGHESDSGRASNKYFSSI